MRFVYPEIDKVFDTSGDKVETLVIEEPGLLRRLAEDVSAQLSGDDGKAVLSEDGKTLALAKRAELIDRFVPFDVSRKALVTKAYSLLEREAVSGGRYGETLRLVGAVGDYLRSLAFELPGNAVFTKLDAGSLIRSAGLEFQSDAESLCGRLLDYFELVTELEGRKLFITLNLRTFADDGDAEVFLDSVLSHGYNLIMLEACERAKLKNEDRYIVDSDLCEIMG